MRNFLPKLAKWIICLFVVIAAFGSWQQGFSTALPQTTFLSTATIGKPYTISLTFYNSDAANSCLNYSWAQLPLGFTQPATSFSECSFEHTPPYSSFQTFQLTGTPMRSGTSTVQIRLSASKGTYSATFSFSLEVDGPPSTPLTLSPSSPLQDATVGQSYSVTFIAGGGAPPNPLTGQTYYSLSFTSNPGDWPAGLTAITLGGDPKATLSGAPTQARSTPYSFAVTVTDAAGTSYSKQYLLTVRPAATTTPPPTTTNPPANPPATASSTYLVFPQFADGSFSDGSYYRTNIMITNPTNTSADCTFRLRGLTVGGDSVFTFSNIGHGSALVNSSINSKQPLKSGYATLECTAAIQAQLLYSYYARGGQKLAEATVFSSPNAAAVELLADNREGSDLAVAVANDSDQSVNYTVTAYTDSGKLAGTFTLAPRTNRAAFLRELVPALPAGFLGAAVVSAGNGTGNVIGLRYTGNVFTTIPGMTWSTVGATASAYHVFPTYADGVFQDGSFYKTTLMFSNTSDSGGDCTFRLFGLTINGSNVFTYSGFASGDWSIESFNSKQPIKSGYATLKCAMPVEAQLLYTYYDAKGTKVSEAAVFSSPPASSVELLADGREGAQLGLAVSNDSDQSATYTISAFDSAGALVGSARLQTDPRSSHAAFLNALITTLPSNYYGPVLISTDTGSASAVGLSYTGAVFTTVPQAQIPAGVSPGAGGSSNPGGGLNSGPVVSSFSAQPSSIQPGQTATLSWTVSNATTVSIDNGIGAVSATGSRSVTPSTTTTYKLTASNASGSASASTTITLGSTASNSLPYRIVDLGKNFYPTAVSDLPLNGGSVIIAGQLGNHAAMWYNGAVTDLDPLLANNQAEPNKESIALGVGTGIVGYKTTGIGYTYGFSYVNGGMDDWSLRTGYGKDTRAYAVNTQSQIAAFGNFPDPAIAGAHFTGGALWENGKITRLPAVAGDVITPVALQTDLLGNHAVMLGNTYGFPTGTVIVDAKTGSVQKVPLSEGLAFNSHNQVVGYGDGGTYLWNGSGTPIKDSSVPHVNPYGKFASLNNNGYAVGAEHLFCIGLPGQYAAADMRAIPLSAILPYSQTGWDFDVPTAINDAGYIVGASSPKQHGFMLIPNVITTKEPSAPSGLAVTLGNIDAKLTWTDTSDNEYWFEIEGRTPTGDFQFLGVAPANATSFNSQVTDKTIFRIRSRNLIGASAYSATVTLTRN